MIVHLYLAALDLHNPGITQLIWLNFMQTVRKYIVFEFMINKIILMSNGYL